MGYIIPVQPLQAQVYANRMLMDDYNFAYISNVQGIKMKSIFEEKLKNQEEELEKKEEKRLLKGNESLSPPPYKDFIQPNPVNLSIKIAEINGKGNNVNLYI